MADQMEKELGFIGRSLDALFGEPRRRRQMKRAPRRVFVDCGANTCTVLRQYIRKYPDFEYYAFEAQPELAAEGAKVIAEYPDKPIHFFGKAVWIRNEPVDFFLATEWSVNHRGGSTLASGHTRNNAHVDYEHPTRVEAIDFSAWLRENVKEDDYVIVKMDIEGAEYDVLEKVFNDGNGPLVDEFIIEFHQHMNENIPKSRHDALVARIRENCHLQVWH